MRHLALARDVRATARRFRPDVVYAHFLVPAGLLATLFGRAPVVLTAHGQDVENALRSRVVRGATGAAVRRAAAVVAVSDWLRRRLESAVPAARGRIEVIDCGVDLDRFSPSDAEAARGSVGWDPIRHGVRLHGGAVRTQERSAPRTSVRDARGGITRIRRRRPVARRARGSAGDRPRRGCAARARGELAAGGRRRLPAEPRRAVRPRDARRDGVRPIGGRDEGRRAAGVCVPGRRRARRSRGRRRARLQRSPLPPSCRDRTPPPARPRSSTTCADRSRASRRSSSMPPVGRPPPRAPHRRISRWSRAARSRRRTSRRAAPRRSRLGGSCLLRPRSCARSSR